MPEHLPDRLAAEARVIESLIREAFAGVTRDGGVSWNEASVIDGDGRDLTEAEARALDCERSWEELVDDPNWTHEPGIGGFNFLDPIGFRYYIAPAMIRCTRERGGEFISYVLQIDDDFKRTLVSLLTSKQAGVVARFVRLMIAMHVADDDPLYGSSWKNAYKSYWRHRDAGNTG